MAAGTSVVFFVRRTRARHKTSAIEIPFVLLTPSRVRRWVYRSRWRCSGARPRSATEAAATAASCRSTARNSPSSLVAARGLRRRAIVHAGRNDFSTIRHRHRTDRHDPHGATVRTRLPAGAFRRRARATAGRRVVTTTARGRCRPVSARHRSCRWSPGGCCVTASRPHAHRQHVLTRTRVPPRSSGFRIVDGDGISPHTPLSLPSTPIRMVARPSGNPMPSKEYQMSTYEP